MPRTTLALASLLLALGVRAALAAPAETAPPFDEAFIRQFAATYAFRLGTPQETAIAPDGDVLFTRTGPRSFVGDLYERDSQSGEVRRVLSAETLLGGGEEQLSAEEKARRERIRQATRGIGGFELSKDGARLLVPLSDRVFLVERDPVKGTSSGKVTELDTGDGFPFDPQLSPKSDRVAFVVDADLWVIDARAGAKPRRLTTRPSPTIEHAVAEFVAQEEMDRTRGYWWSPDGTRIAYQRNDVSKVDTLYVADPAHPDRAPTPFRYPRAGTANAEVTLGVVPVAGGETRWIEWDHARWPYLTRVHWPDRGPLTLVVMNRAQTELAILAADESTGKTRTLLTETDPAWLDLPDRELPRWLADGSGFLWASERSGSWQLELRKADGSLDRELLPAGFGLQRYAGFDDSTGTAWVIGSADPTQAQVWRVPLHGEPQAVTREVGLHDVEVARRGGWAVTVSAFADGSKRWDVRRPDGMVAGELPAVAEEPPWLPSVEWTTVKAEGRDFHAALVRPRAFETGKRYPVLVHIYAGPTSQMVRRSPRGYLLDQWYADAGFVVVSIDGRGTPNRGRDWERAVHKDLISVALQDQADALRALGEKYPELDLARVGIYGWSFGGYASALAVLLRPDVYHAAVAGAPVTDWTLYDTFYTERYMQTPQENPEGYKNSSAIAHAAELTRPLLVIHGTADDNVYFANSLGLVQALFRAGKEVELLPVSATHMTPDPEVALALHRKQLAFFREHLR
ncbi:MAG TPA: DPP IV N-terminal domain-containing protein [Thermoanaerobaculia bacterium]|nr:DPP IV N-terminal domain-containing protein [Thermoanaerobaculia bacterium]